jgi:hypothetical protein
MDDIEFCKIVLNHLQQMSEDQWAYYREQCNGESPFNEELAANQISLIKDNREIILPSLCSDGIPLSNLLKNYANSERIIVTNLHGQPVYFFPVEGVYAWASNPDDYHHFSIWLTYPAYPKNWR